jgi:hypothetical protein
MARSYRQCECGKRALSIATRCPACGRELVAPPVKEETGGFEIGRFISPGTLKWGAAGLVVLLMAIFALRARPSSERASAAADSAGASSEVGFSRETTLGTASAAVVAPEGAGELRVARTWTHVRSGRRVSSDVQAVLLPGDTVVVDSLKRGWYRVALEGEVLGYAHQSTLLRPGEVRKEAKSGR